MTCVRCRAQLQQDRLVVPCDVGGLPACRFWDTHGASPGEKEHPDDTLAFALYGDGRRMGLEVALQFRHLELSPYEADTLMLRLRWLLDHYEALEATYLAARQPARG